jgi:hypothetical protein
VDVEHAPAEPPVEVLDRDVGPVAVLRRFNHGPWRAYSIAVDRSAA